MLARHKENMGLETLWREMAEICPVFAINGENVKIIKEPSTFYRTLLELSEKACRRIVLSSLYLGTGGLEKNLVDTLTNALSKGVRITVLLDYSRGTRGDPDSCSMLLPLLTDNRGNTGVYLFHSPLLRGILKLLLPVRWNEIISVQHMKLYIFDDTLIISGANLSHDYFTSRQDRYITISNCGPLADFYTDLVAAVSRFSFQLHPNGQLNLSSGTVHPFLGICFLFKIIKLNINEWN
ncbi:unnamed protein product [Soboliphyme baturini]|uniref:CDP-diacylglycerol--glycerol-3-phosphate 3-phosphatidyltransferase n=1 Tax=Soboliphyme baturini TaxID=241478 RepID=A0A183IQ16_9BILA|nr:unnamed protein product [Soboliphyme baturini]